MATGMRVISCQPGDALAPGLPVPQAALSLLPSPRAPGPRLGRLCQRGTLLGPSSDLKPQRPWPVLLPSLPAAHACPSSPKTASGDQCSRLPRSTSREWFSRRASSTQFLPTRAVQRVLRGDSNRTTTTLS